MNSIPSLAEIDELRFSPRGTIDELHHEISLAIARAGSNLPEEFQTYFGRRSTNGMVTSPDGLPKWVDIYFTERAAAELGQPGISISTVKLLRWLADDVWADWVPSEYYYAIAAAIGDEPPFSYRTIDDYEEPKLASQLRRWAELKSSGLSRAAIEHIKWLEELSKLGSDSHIEIPLPLEPVPPGSGLEVCERYLVVPVGLAMTYIARHIEQENVIQATQWRKVVETCYPDESVEIEVTTREGDNFFLVDVAPVGQYDSGSLMEEIVGSVRIVNYGTGSAYSQDKAKYPYELRLSGVDDGEECLLVSKDVRLRASISRND